MMEGTSLDGVVITSNSNSTFTGVFNFEAAETPIITGDIESMGTGGLPGKVDYRLFARISP